MNQTPTSPYIETDGLVYFARMLDKIRKMDRGELRQDFQENLGKAFDGLCTGFLRVSYDDLRKFVLSEDSDQKALDWCFEKGRPLDKGDKLIWNSFMKKAGYKDFLSEKLSKYKLENGLSQREDIETLFDFMEVDEGRKK